MVYSYLKNIFNNYSEALNDYIYEALKNYNDFNYSMTLFYNFIVNNRNLIRDLKEALNNDTVLNALSQAIHYEDKVVDGLKNLILSDNNTVEFIFEIVQYKSIINVIFIMIRNAEKRI